MLADASLRVITKDVCIEERACDTRGAVEGGVTQDD
jgi:hypothetical protein